MHENKLREFENKFLKRTFGPGLQEVIHSVQTDSGAHPASYSMGKGGPFPGVKSDRA
jgi:hypothetical protein